MTLIELMVSMGIGLFLTWGAIEIYVQSKGNYRASEATTRLQENARFALETLDPDLRLAGFWGTHAFDRVEVPAGIAVACAGVDVSDWALDLETPVAAIDDDYDLDCEPFREARPGSDVLVLRHASEIEAAPQAGQVQIQADLSYAELFDDGGIPDRMSVASSTTRDLAVHAYYVDEQSSFSDALPSLRRKTLVRGNVIEDQEMVTGVENLQVQFGLDSDGDGAVERYVDPDDPAAATQRILAVRLWLLVRSEDSPAPGFQDLREYQPPDADAAAIVPGTEGYPAGFLRLDVTKTVYLRNRLGRS